MRGNRFPNFVKRTTTRRYKSNNNNNSNGNKNNNSNNNNSSSRAANYFGQRRRTNLLHLLHQPSNASSSNTTTTTFTRSMSQQRWNQLAWIVKITRIPILLGAVYSLGYQQGVLDSIRNPNKIQQGSFESACMEMGVHSGDQIDIIWERRPPPSLSRLGWLRLFGNNNTTTEEEQIKDPRAHRVADIGREIIRAARRYVTKELQYAMDQKRQEIQQQQQEQQQDEQQEPMSEHELALIIQEDDQVQKWIRAYERIEGYTHDGIQNWQYVLLQTPIPNAFVSEMLPQRFFVTTGIFDNFVTTDDELAMILGHELSHLILGHGSERILLEFMIRGLEIAFLMLDPTEGMLSLGIASFLASTRDALTANHSRETEREADELGCTLAAMACYDIERGCDVFRRMHDFDVKQQGHVVKDIMSTHPASMERYEFVKQLSQKMKETKNSNEYDSYCGTLVHAIMRGRALSIMNNNNKQQQQ